MRNVFYLAGVMCLGLFMSSCTQQQAGEIYQNPLLDQDFPDPAVLKAEDGWIYAYATQSGVNIQMARSQDLVHWEYLGDAMPDKPAWANQMQDFWAPDVFYDEENKTYYLYFSSTRNAAEGHCIGVATSKSPPGPFTDVGAPVICGEGFVNIDPMAFDDPRTGKKLLYWGSGFEPLKVRELADNRAEFKQDTQIKEIVFPGKEKNYTNLLEAPWLTYREGMYYLFYSGDNCCGAEANYAVMVARSESATGPFTRFGEVEASESGSSVILEKNSHWLAPGHNSVIKDDKGHYWMLYHAIDLTPSENGSVNYSRRVLLIDRIYYKNGWPYMKKETPSSGSQPRPFFRE